MKNRVVDVTISILLLTSMLTLTFDLQLVNASENIHTRPDGSLDHACMDASGPLPANSPAARTYTLDADFDEGTLVGVEHETVHDQLQLSTNVTTLPFIWVPNNEGTVSKINTNTGKELGRYWVSSGTGSSPSRTTVDLQGNCWVGCRQRGTVVKIGLYEAGQWIDRNGDGICQTSQDTNDDGEISGDEILLWGQDECVLYEVVLVPGFEGTYAPGTYTGPYDYDYYGVAPRGLAVDSASNLWAGTWSSSKYYYVDGTTGAITRSLDVSTHNAYGAVIDEEGILWSAEGPGSPDGEDTILLRLDPSTDAKSFVDIGHTCYGLGLDYNHHLWVSSYWNDKLSRIDVLVNPPTFVTYNTPEQSESRGVAATSDNNIWVANTGAYTVTRYDNNGTLVATITGLTGPTGVSVDSNGKVWATDNYDEYVHRIDPATNMIDFSKQIVGSAGHYTYSDMTGIVSRSITTKIGTWTVIFDSAVESASWGTVSWNYSEPPGTSITVKVRSSNDTVHWATWETAANEVPLHSTPNGRYLEIETALQIITGNVSPILYDLTVSECYSVTIKAHCNTEEVDIGVVITMDGSPTGFSTPHTFTDLIGTHNFTVPDTDACNHPFRQWNTDETYTTITVSDSGIYTAYYWELYDVTIKAYCYTEATNVSVVITMDGSPTGFSTPHTFTDLIGTHTFTVPSTDATGHAFNQWNTGGTSTTLAISSGRSFTAFYGTPSSSSTPIIRAEPEKKIVRAGEYFDVKLKIFSADIEALNEVHAWQVYMTWDPTVLDMFSVTWGDFLDGPRIGPWGFLTQNASAGQKRLNVATGLSKFMEGYEVLIIDDNHSEINTIASVWGNELTMQNNLSHNYTVTTNGGVYADPSTLPALMINENLGYVIAGTTSAGPAPGVSGDGWLCTFTFYVEGSGETALNISSLNTYFINTIGEVKGDENGELIKENGVVTTPWSEDVNADGKVDVFDLYALGKDWGKCPIQIRNPATTTPPSGEWTDPANAYTSNNLYASAASTASQIYGSYGIPITGWTGVSKVEVGLERRTLAGGDDRVIIAVSNDGGSSWSTTTHTVDVTQTTDTFTWYDFTSAYSWTPNGVANIAVQITYRRVGGPQTTIFVDWLPVRVTPLPQSTSLFTDVNGDGAVNAPDLVMLESKYGETYDC